MLLDNLSDSAEIILLNFDVFSGKLKAPNVWINFEEFIRNFGFFLSIFFLSSRYGLTGRNLILS